MARNYFEKKNDAQIMRVDRKNCFVELMNSCFSIGKLLFNFCSYDENTHRMTDKLEIYMDFDEAAGLAELILSGALERRMREAAETKKYMGKAVNDFTSYYCQFSGKNYPAGSAKFRELTEKYSRLRTTNSGIVLSKQLKIQKPRSYSYAITLRAEYANGKEGETGAVMPDGEVFSYVNIPMTQIQMLGMASMIKMAIQAYLNQFYAKYSESLFKGDNCRLFVAEPQRRETGTKQNAIRTENAEAFCDGNAAMRPQAQISSADITFTDKAFTRIEDGPMAYVNVELNGNTVPLYFDLSRGLGGRKDELVAALRTGRPVNINYSIRTRNGQNYCLFCG